MLCNNAVRGMRWNIKLRYILNEDGFLEGKRSVKNMVVKYITSSSLLTTPSSI